MSQTHLDVADSLKCVNKHLSALPQSLQQHLRHVQQQLQGIVPTRNRVMHGRPLEFDDYTRVTDLCRALVKAQTFLWRETRRVQSEIRQNPNYVTALSMPETDDVASKLHNLPAPDFGDTGFLGRQDEFAELKRAVTGSYPVITLLGEGGVGKSALALKLSYEIVDDPKAPFDGVIWTTAKANRLTPHEIQEIDGAITSSMRLLASAASAIGRQSHDDPMNDLIMHLTDAKILLVIDNLETVLDEIIRDLVRRVPSGSKILFTTRVGLGAFDFPIDLKPFSPKEAHFFLRRACQVWGLNEIAKFPEQRIEDYCCRLQYNPMFIKWFVQGVKSGQKLRYRWRQIMRLCGRGTVVFWPDVSWIRKEQLNN